MATDVVVFSLTQPHTYPRIPQCVISDRPEAWGRPESRVFENIRSHFALRIAERGQNIRSLGQSSISHLAIRTMMWARMSASISHFAARFRACLYILFLYILFIVEHIPTLLEVGRVARQV